MGDSDQCGNAVPRKEEALNSALVTITTPLRNRRAVRWVSSSKNILQIVSGPHTSEIAMHRYVCEMQEACFQPGKPGFLSMERDTVVSPLLLDVRPSASGNHFGTFINPIGADQAEVYFPRKTMEVNGRAICLHIPEGAGVFILDALIGLYRIIREINKKVPVLIPQNVNTRYKEYFSFLGLTDHDFVEVPNDSVAKVERAIFSSRSLATDTQALIGGKKRDFGALVEPVDLNDFNTKVQNSLGGRNRRRIFVSRRDVTSRQIENEEDLINMLSEFGFEPMRLSEIPVPELISAFANAEIVVAPIGSGMVNVAFSPPGTPIIEIDHPHNDFVTHGVCRALEHPLNVHQPISATQRRRHATHAIHVNVEALRNAVRDNLASRTW